jgi:thermostable 8-oxoguanine DNA glycosylase
MTSYSKEGTVLNPFLFDASHAQLESQILLSAFVAGKTARVQQKKLEQFWLEVWICWARKNRWHESTYNFQRLEQKPPWWWLTELTQQEVRACLEAAKVGQYTRLTKFIVTVFSAIAARKLDLKTCTREELIQYPGFNLKSASFFLLFTRREAEDQMACLDTHILAYLREKGIASEAPKSSPSGKQYLELEQKWLQHKRAINRNGAELDFEIWLERSSKSNEA